MYSLSLKLTVLLAVFSITFNWQCAIASAEGDTSAPGAKGSTSDVGKHQKLAPSKVGNDKNKPDLKEYLEEEWGEWLSALMDIGRYDRAASLLESNSPNDKSKEYLMLLTIPYFAAGQYSKSIDLCQQILTKISESDTNEMSQVFEIMGACYYKMKEYKKAVLAFSESIRIEPDARKYKARAKAYLGLSEGLKAQADYDKVRELGKAVMSITENVELKMLQHSGAPLREVSPAKFNGAGNLKDWEHACQIFKEGQSLENNGQFSKAENSYKRATKISSTDPAFWNALALCEMTEFQKRGWEKEDYKSIEEMFLRATALDENNWRLWNNFAVLEVIKSDFMSAKPKFEKAYQAEGLTDAERSSIQSALGLCANMFQLKEKLKKGRTD